jgi:lysophospholipase L1-like esterase
MKIRILTLVLIVFSACAHLDAQLVDEYNPPRANCCLATNAKSLADQLQDWNQLDRYYQADLQLKSEPAEPNRVVFMGDSITDFWKLDQYFPGKPYINRGISGQTTPQMLVRMYPDVIDLKPAAMVLLAGTNDIAHNTGPATAEMIEENIMAITELAERHGIKVVLCSITPVSDYPYLKEQNDLAKNPQATPVPRSPFSPPRQKMTEGRPPADILKLNAWLKDYAASVNAIYVDYFGAMVDEKGFLNDEYSGDGLHPNAEGYKLMAPLVDAALAQALR